MVCVFFFSFFFFFNIMVTKCDHLFKSYGNFAEWVDFAYWWNCIGNGLWYIKWDIALGITHPFCILFCKIWSMAWWQYRLNSVLWSIEVLLLASIERDQLNSSLFGPHFARAVMKCKNYKPLSRRASFAHLLPHRGESLYLKKTSVPLN